MRGIAAAFAGTAALLLAQSFLFQHASGEWVAPAVRAGFAALDVLLFASLVGAAAERSVRSLAIWAAALVGYEMLVDFGGLFQGSRRLARSLAGGEPIVAMGLALLVLLLVRAEARARGHRPSRALLAVVLASVAVGAAFRIGPLAWSDPDERGRPAWVAWGSLVVDAVRMLAVAASALAASRVVTDAPRAASASPYRDAEEVPRSGPAPIPPAWSDVATALDKMRSFYFVRLAMPLVATMLVYVADKSHSDVAVGLIIVLVMGVSVATAALLARGYLRVRLGPHVEGVRTRATVVVACLAVSIACDVVAMGAILYSLGSYHRDPVAAIFAVPCAAVAVLGSHVVAASALVRVGEALGFEDVVFGSRRVQALSIVSVVAAVAGALTGMDGTVAALELLAVGTWIAAYARQIGLLGAVVSAIRARAVIAS